MNSLPGRAALSLCRRTAAGGMKLLAASSPAHPAGGLAASLQAVRVCHSGTRPQGSVKTKKRGYDITRNPHLNKVSSLVSLRWMPLLFMLCVVVFMGVNVVQPEKVSTPADFAEKTRPSLPDWFSWKKHCIYNICCVCVRVCILLVHIHTKQNACENRLSTGEDEFTCDVCVVS